MSILVVLTNCSLTAYLHVGTWILRYSTVIRKVTYNNGDKIYFGIVPTNQPTLAPGEKKGPMKLMHPTSSLRYHQGVEACTPCS